MTTTARNLDEGAGVFHVYCRGNNGQKVLEQESQKKSFLHLVTSAKKRYDFDIYNYAVMDNHYHFLLDVVGLVLPKVMHFLNRGYSECHKRLENRVGRLWQGRYKSTPIKDLNHLLTCAAYIELNPVRAGIVADPGDYRWSSYRHYAFGEKNDLVTENPEFVSLAHGAAERRRIYGVLTKMWLQTETAPVPKDPLFQQVEINGKRYGWTEKTAR